VIWAKNTFTLGRADYQRQYEPILYGWKEGSDHSNGRYRLQPIYVDDLAAAVVERLTGEPTRRSAGSDRNLPLPRNGGDDLP
jgi:uncharacterized protein YbjT (DUF2867 family)